MRLIDADALMGVLGIADECKDCSEPKKGIYCEKSLDFRVACQAITDAPTIETEPIKRGKWKHIPEEPFAGIYVCSVCNKQAEVNSFEEWLLTDYCPFCGAKMILNDENNID